MGSPSDNDVVEDRREGPVLRVRVRPRSTRRGVLGTGGGMLSVGVAAAPEGGRATAEALRAIADWLGVAPSRLSLVSGARSRSKRFSVRGETAASLRRRVAQGFGPPPRSRGERKPNNRP